MLQLENDTCIEKMGWGVIDVLKRKVPIFVWIIIPVSVVVVVVVIVILIILFCKLCK
jgi:hypothetical protein